MKITFFKTIDCSVSIFTNPSVHQKKYSISDYSRTYYSTSKENQSTYSPHI
ncbi:hypothetical protein HMPREF9518_02261 [Enterococcus faecalis TX1342]|nr:hypothetical protein HMPREF9518_02261 [Enterococcus faecalis TX1342]